MYIKQLWLNGSNMYIVDFRKQTQLPLDDDS